MRNSVWRSLGAVAVAMMLGTQAVADAESAASFPGKIGLHFDDSVQAWPQLPRPPQGAPNVLIWLIDDAGFAQLGSYGGLIEAPTLDRLAQGGLRYTNFHVTGVCSPTRAALMTGRNPHAVHFGAHVKGARGFPGYDGFIPRSAASMAKVLGEQGYATYAFGKWDQLPGAHANPSGPFDFWPSGQGFEHFYGFLAAEANQYQPQVYADHTPVEPGAGRSDYIFTSDIAERAIASINQLNAASPDRPFLLYWATGAVHAPHHAPPSYIEKYRGRFDRGWDWARDQILASQKKLGVIPQDTQLPPRPDFIPAWDSLSPDAKKMYARQMEVFAAQLEHADHEFGRILAALQRNGRLDNTLVIVTSDNGASAEGGPEGSYNELRFSNGLSNTLPLNLAHYDEWGSRSVENHYSAGWAMAGNTPFKYFKQTMFNGGVRVPLIVSWPKGQLPSGQVRGQFHYISDIMPTVLAAAGIPQPSAVDGVKQEPLDGVDMSYSFRQPQAPTAKPVQYFELWGNRAIVADGWKAIVNHYDQPWLMMQAKPFSEDRWELYRVSADINERDNVADKYPQKLAELQQLFDREAKRNNVYPLKSAGDGSRDRWQMDEARIRAVSGHFIYRLPGVERLPEELAPPLINRSYTIDAQIDVPKAGAEGVLVSMGGEMAGWTFFVKNNRLAFTHNFMAEQWYDIRAQQPLTPGRHTVQFVFRRTGSFKGLGELRVDGVKVGEGAIERTYPAQVPINETFDIGRDNGTSPSRDYQVPFVFTGHIEQIDVAVAAGKQ